MEVPTGSTGRAGPPITREYKNPIKAGVMIDGILRYPKGEPQVQAIPRLHTTRYRLTPKEMSKDLA